MSSETKERPIPLNGAMVRAILDGSKTQTRRLISPQPVWGLNKGCLKPCWNWKQYGFLTDNGGHNVCMPPYCPYGQPGDRLWVRETWKHIFPECGGPIEYRADHGEDSAISGGWKPSIHMPRSASRIDLGIVSVRVERLQAISEDDAYAEGYKPNAFYRELDANVAASRLARLTEDAANSAAKVWFRDLWDSINAARGFGWNTNPWVWAVSFEPLAASARTTKGKQ
jgi:hypothetical protein